jgi:hypothetical protein
MATTIPTGKRVLTQEEKEMIHDAYFGRELNSTQIAKKYRIARQWVPQVARRVRAKREKAQTAATVNPGPSTTLEGVGENTPDSVPPTTEGGGSDA